MELFDENAMYEKYTKTGKSLSLGGEELMKYVEKKVSEGIARHERNLERQERERNAERKENEAERKDKAAEREENERKRRHEVEMGARGGTENVASNRVSIKLSGYKDGEDVDIYLKTYESVKKANGWTNEVAITALRNGFTNSKVSQLIASMPTDISYNDMKTEILKSFGYTVYDYRMKFKTSKQVSENFRQYVLRMNSYLNRWCTLSNVEKDFDKLRQLMVKDQILQTVSRDLADYLMEKMYLIWS